MPTVPAGAAPAARCSVVSPEAAKLEFDVASVKLTSPGRVSLLSGGPGTNEPGRLSAGRIQLQQLIGDTYDLQFDQVKGPAWLSTVYVTISATMPPTTTKDQYCGMLRNLLAERFHLAFHHENQTRPGYELTVIPGGPKFSEYIPEPGDPAAEPSSGSPRERDANNFYKIPAGVTHFMASAAVDGGPEKLSFRGTMGEFAGQIGSTIYRLNGASGPRARVADHTGLSGIYDIRVEYTAPPGPPRAAMNDAAPDLDRPRSRPVQRG